VTAARTQRAAPGSIPAIDVVAAGKLYVATVRARSAPDRAFSEALRKLHNLSDAQRTFAVETAQAMLRVRARLDHAAKAVPFELTMHARVCMYLAGAAAIPARLLPGDAKEIAQLAAAWHATAAAPLAVRASVPAFVVDALVAARGPQEAEALCLSFTRAPPLTLRANTLQTTRDDLLQALASEGHAGTPTERAPEGVTLAQRANVFRTAAFREGLFEVQDEGSQLVSLACGARPGMVVVDGCAGAGGKTLHLAALMGGKGTLHAFDVHKRRLADLKERAARAGAHNIRVHALDDDGVSVRAGLRGLADVVLVDAPCSGTGVFRRNPDTSWSLVPADVARMIEQQSAILDDYAPLVRPGGRLVYATCSVLPDENEAQVAAFLVRHSEFSRGDVLAVDPAHGDTDGFFAASFMRGL
jgi:16S rRNA (cytosine967-C5)-methyltransferase